MSTSHITSTHTHPKEDLHDQTESTHAEQTTLQHFEMQSPLSGLGDLERAQLAEFYKSLAQSVLGTKYLDAPLVVPSAPLPSDAGYNENLHRHLSDLKNR